MKLTVLGCNGPYPASGGACSGYLLEAAGARVLLDCGCGVLPRLTALLAPETLDAVIVTHLHYDHMSDLLPLVYRCNQAGKRLRLLAPDAPHPLLPLLREGYDVEPLGRPAAIGGLTVRALPVRHPLPAYAVRLEGEGKRFCYTGDTNACPGLSDFAAGVDCLLADACFPEALWNDKLPHMSARLAAQTALEAQAGRLVLTHFRPDIAVDALLAEARTVYPKAVAAESGLTLSW